MNYSSVAMGFCNEKYGDLIYMSFLRYYFGVHCKAPILAVIGVFGWLTVIFQH